MDNLDSAIEYGYITEKEVKLLEVLRMPAKDAKKPPKGVPKTFKPEVGAKEKLKKLSPRQKAELKARGGSGKKTKDGIQSFGLGDKGNSVGSAGGSNYSGDGQGGQVNMDNVGGSTGNVLRNVGGQWQIQNEATGQRIGNDGKAYEVASPAVKQQMPSQITPASWNSTAALAQAAIAPDFAGPASSMSIANPAPQIGGTTPAAMVAAVQKAQGTAPAGGFTSSYGAPGGEANDANNLTKTVSGEGKGSLQTVSAPGKTSLPSTTINKTPGPAGLIGPADQTVNKGITSPANVTFIEKNPEGPVPVDDIVAPVTQAERNLMNKVKQPTTYARIDSPSSLETLGSAGSIFDTPLADRPGTFDNSELTNIVSGNQPQKANRPTREAYADNIASDPTAGRMKDSLSSLAGQPGKIDDRMAQVGGMGGPRGSLTNPPSPDAVTAARDAILGPAGTLTGPYDVKAPIAQPAGTLTKPYEPAKPTAIAAGTLTTPYEKEIAIPGIEPAPLTGSPATRPQMPTYGTGPLQDVDQVTSLPARPGQTTPPGWGVPDVPQMKADQTVEKGITLPQNVTFINKTPAVEPDSPLSPLATAKPRAFGLDGYQGPQAAPAAPNPAIAAGTLTGPYNAPANDNDSELQGLADNTIADQSLPGGLPSAQSGGGPRLGQGGQPAPTAKPAGDTTPPPPVTPPPPAPDQVDPYAGIMPWDRIAYDAIKKSYEASGKPYTPADFIASFYNMKAAA